MKVKMTPLHGRFKDSGEGFKGPTIKIAMEKANIKIPGMTTKLSPMVRRNIKEDGYTGSSKPKAASGDESKAKGKIKSIP